MFKRVFGGGNPSGTPNAATTEKTISAIQNLNEREEQLDKKKTLLEKKILDELEKAKEFTRAKKKPQVVGGKRPATRNLVVSRCQADSRNHFANFTQLSLANIPDVPVGPQLDRQAPDPIDCGDLVSA